MLSPLCFRVPALMLAFTLWLAAPRARGQVLPERGAVSYPGSAPADSAEAHDIILLIRGQGHIYPDSVLSKLAYARQLSHRSGFSWGIAKTLQLSGIVCSHAGRFNEAEEYLRQLIYYCLSTGRHMELLALGYNILGNIYQVQGRYAEAAYYYHRTLKLSKEYVPESTIALIYLNLGRLTHKMKQPRKALYYLDRADSISQVNRLYELHCYVNSTRGMIYTDMGIPDTAMYYLRESMRLIRQRRHLYTDSLQDVEYTNMVFLADHWLRRGNLDSAGACIRKTQKIQTFVVPQYRNKANLVTGQYYLRLGKYPEAERYLHTVLDSLQRTHAFNDLATVHRALSDLYDAIGQHKRALMHIRFSVALNDSLENIRVADNVHQLEVRYRTAEKDRELVSQKLEIAHHQHAAREKNLWIAIITAGMLSLGIVSIALYKKRQTDKALQQKEIQLLRQQQQVLEQEQQTLRREQEIERLKAMMKGEERERSRLARELHDGIGGMITAIRMNLGSARKKNAELAQSAPLTEIMRMLEDTGVEIRKTAHNLMPEILVRHSLPDALLIFCEHIYDDLPTELSCEGDFSQLDKSTELLIYRMVQELIQNIIKHASATQASVELILFNGRLSLTVEDNGTGFDADQEHPGFGLDNLRYRIAALEGELTITSEQEKSTAIHIEFDLEKLKNIT